MELYIKIFANLFAICDPVGLIPIYLGMTADIPALERRKIPWTIVVTVFIVLCLSVFVGYKILNFFGISTHSFKVAGGLLMVWIAFDMLHMRRSRTKQSPEEVEEASHDLAHIGVVPLAIPMVAGPGSIGAVILYAQESSLGHKFALCGVIALFCVVSFYVLKLAEPIGKRLGAVGINVGTRLMGLIVAALGVEFVLGGVRGFFE